MRLVLFGLAVSIAIGSIACTSSGVPYGISTRGDDDDREEEDDDERQPERTSTSRARTGSADVDPEGEPEEREPSSRPRPDDDDDDCATRCAENLVPKCEGADERLCEQVCSHPPSVLDCLEEAPACEKADWNRCVSGR